MTDIAPRFEDGRSMLLAGIRRKITFVASHTAITAMWTAFATAGEMPGQCGRVAYGVMAGTDEQAGTFEYACAVEVASFERLPAATGRIRVPAAHYAVFAVDGGAESVPLLWRAIMDDWAPNSGYAHAPSPSFERYDETFRPGSAGGIEIWLPIMRR